MYKIYIGRAYYPDCTISRIKTSTGKVFMCAERPYLGNKPNKSCIDEGLYSARIRYSPNAKRDVITLDDKNGRTWINIESGNMVSGSLGCLFIGKGVADINGDGVIDATNSAAALDELIKDIENSGATNIYVSIYSATKVGSGVYSGGVV